jgi:hypothetical protein
MTIRSDLDELIDWYQVHQPHVVGRVIPIVATEATVAQFARKNRVRGGPYIYRDCEIVPIARKRKLRQKTDNKQPELQT